jgi:hypothetical protein
MCGIASLPGLNKQIVQVLIFVLGNTQLVPGTRMNETNQHDKLHRDDG